MPAALIAFGVGLIFGSFANVLIYRLPRGLSILFPPSHCPACDRRLPPMDLIPVVSWLVLGGHCRYCKAPISMRYPTVELSCGGLFLCMAVYTQSVAVVPLCALAFVLLCVAYVDYDTQEIPDGLLIFGAVVGVLWGVSAFFTPTDAPPWHDALLGAVAGAAPLFGINCVTLWLLKKDGFGFGDVKLMAMAGLFLGWQMALVALFFAIVAGGIFGTILLLTKRLSRGGYFAFGPFLAIGILGALWFGTPYLRLMWPIR